MPAGTFYNSAANDSTGGNFNYNLGTDRPIGGATLGCNWQLPFWPMVVGFESEGGYLKLGSSGAIPYSSGTGWNTRSTTHVGDWYGSLSGRLGIAWDRLLFYFKGGVGFTNIAGAVTDNCSAAPCSASLLVATESSRQPFWVAGAGIEYAVPNTPWSIKGEAFILRYVQILRGLRPG